MGSKKNLNPKIVLRDLSILNSAFQERLFCLHERVVATMSALAVLAKKIDCKTTINEVDLFFIIRSRQCKQSIP